MKTGTLVRARPQQPRPPALQSQGNLEWLYDVLGVARPTASLPVTEKTISGLTGVSAAVAKIANACSAMMCDADAYTADDLEIEDVPVLQNPCTGYDSFTYWREVFSTALMRGNWFGIKADFDFSGYPRQVVPVPVDSVHARYEEGFLVYDIAGEDYAPDELVHIKIGLTIPGLPMAIGVIESHRRALSGQLDMEGMANGVWQAGAVPSGIVQLDVDLPSKEQADTTKANWVDRLGGKRTVAVIGKRMTYTPVTWNAQDAQWLESRQFSIAEAALWFGLRPEDLGSSFGSSGALTYGNRTDDALQRITDSYMPHVIPVEQAWSRLIPGKNYIEADVDALLRSSTRERYELHQIAQTIGLETVNETRDDEGKPPLPETATPPPAVTIGPAVAPDLAVPPGTVEVMNQTALSPTDTQVSGATPMPMATTPGGAP